MCKMGICEEYCIPCDKLVNDAGRFAIPCQAAVAKDKLCAVLGPVDTGEVRKCLTVCVECFQLLDS